MYKPHFLAKIYLDNWGAVKHGFRGTGSAEKKLLSYR
jgi:hypothetical protein